MVKSDLPVSDHTLQNLGLLSSNETNECLVASRHLVPAVKTGTETSTAPVVEAAGVTVSERNSDRVYLCFKRFLDVTVAVLVLAAMLPLLALIAIALVIDNPGPILFSQMRVGRNNKLFRFYKFRSMVKNAPALQAQLKAENEAAGPIFKMRRDPRVTRVGRILRKFSLDELPQLFNVLRGEMSLVGPRPHLPSEVAQYADHQLRRLTVQPGLVCLREVSGRSELTFERWIELDLHYISCRSLRTDLSILIRLLPAVICGHGAY